MLLVEFVTYFSSKDKIGESPLQRPNTSGFVYFFVFGSWIEKKKKIDSCKVPYEAMSTVPMHL